MRGWKGMVGGVMTPPYGVRRMNERMASGHPYGVREIADARWASLRGAEKGWGCGKTGREGEKARVERFLFSGERLFLECRLPAGENYGILE